MTQYPSIDRRAVIETAGAVIAGVGIAGCAGPDDEEQEPGEGQEPGVEDEPDQTDGENVTDDDTTD